MRRKNPFRENGRFFSGRRQRWRWLLIRLAMFLLSLGLSIETAQAILARLV